MIRFNLMTDVFVYGGVVRRALVYAREELRDLVEDVLFLYNDRVQSSGIGYVEDRSLRVDKEA